MLRQNCELRVGFDDFSSPKEIHVNSVSKWNFRARICYKDSLEIHIICKTAMIAMHDWLKVQGFDSCVRFPDGADDQRGRAERA